MDRKNSSSLASHSCVYLFQLLCIRICIPYTSCIRGTNFFAGNLMMFCLVFPCLWLLYLCAQLYSLLTWFCIFHTTLFVPPGTNRLVFSGFQTISKLSSICSQSRLSNPKHESYYLLLSLNPQTLNVYMIP